MRKILDKYKNISLTDSEVMKLVKGKANVILYHNIHKYRNLNQLLYPYGAAFILYEAKPYYGHWVALMLAKNKKTGKIDTLEYFDPYGTYPDYTLKKYKPEMKKKLNEDYPYLSQLILDSPYRYLSYNEFPFQKHGKKISTCGRWSALRILFRHLTLEQFKKLFLYDNGDDLVTLLSMYINK